jgi:hypothetical protein
MDEAPWQACAEPERMLDFLRGRTTDRKLRLFGVACCRRVAHHLTDPRSLRVVEASEQYASGWSRWGELYGSQSAAGYALGAVRGRGVAQAEAAWAAYALASDPTALPGMIARLAEHAATAAGAQARGEAYERVWQAPGLTFAARSAADQAAFDAGRTCERRAQADLLRDIYRPFRAAAVDADWLTWGSGTVAKLAAAIYDERAFDRLPVLADALEEAGCADAELLAHLRGPGPHVRGCWAVDALLGKR